MFAASLAFGAMSARADDEQPAVHHHHAKATKTGEKLSKQDVVTREHPATKVKGSNIIPTRDDRNSQEVLGHDLGGANGPEYRVPTGSNIPKRYNRRGYTTDSDQNSFIIDKNDQRLRSHDNVGEAVRSIPGVNVSGPRGL